MLKVKLSASQNPDLPTRILPARRVVRVGDLREASDACRRYIVENDLGGGNWSGGEVTDATGVPVARISYNGRVWEPGPWSSTKEIALP